MVHTMWVRAQTLFFLTPFSRILLPDTLASIHINLITATGATSLFALALL